MKELFSIRYTSHSPTLKQKRRYWYTLGQSTHSQSYFYINYDNLHLSLTIWATITASFTLFTTFFVWTSFQFKLALLNLAECLLEHYMLHIHSKTPCTVLVSCFIQDFPPTWAHVRHPPHQATLVWTAARTAQGVCWTPRLACSPQFPHSPHGGQQWLGNMSRTFTISFFCPNINWRDVLLDVLKNVLLETSDEYFVKL